MPFIICSSSYSYIKQEHTNNRCSEISVNFGPHRLESSQKESSFYSQKPRAGFQKMAITVISSLSSALSLPLPAQADTFPSFDYLLYSLLVGVIVSGSIAAAVVAVTNYDPVDRA